MKRQQVYTAHLGNQHALLCPECGKKLDGVTSTHDRIPQDNDITICVYCKTLLVYRQKNQILHFERMTRKDLAQLKSEFPDVYNELIRNIAVALNMNI